MSEQLDNLDEESFIILGTSPGTSLDIKCGNTKPASMQNGVNDVVENSCLDKAQIEEALQELSLEGSMALKASFKIGDSPSPASMMVASTLITDDKSTEELQKRFGEILDENIVLKETLKQNNDSLKEHFFLIATCQEDMVKTHELHKEKFEETKELVERLRQENRKLKCEIAALTETLPVNDETGEVKDISGVKLDPKTNPADGLNPSATNHNEVKNGFKEVEVDSAEVKENGPSSVMEFVTSPDDEIVEKLSAQLALVEKQRREVIIENEKLTWQKESLENIVDATAKERDDLKDKLKEAECLLATKVNEHSQQIVNMTCVQDDLRRHLQNMNLYPALQQRDVHIKQQNEKYAALQADLKAAQMRILELENVKLEFAKYKTNTVEIMRQQKEKYNDLNNKFKETSAAMLQPAKFVITWEAEGKEYGSMGKQVKLYDRAMEHLTDMLRRLTNGLSDVLLETMNVLISTNSASVGRSDGLKASLDVLATRIEGLQADAMSNVGQVRATLEIFQDIFNEYKDAIRKAAASETKQPANVEALTAALVARGEEIQGLQKQVHSLQQQIEDVTVLKAQLDLYKSDFEAERRSREEMASLKEAALTDLRKTQKLYEDLKKQVEQNKRVPTASARSSSATATASAPAPASAPPKVYTCPKCMRFKSSLYEAMEEHFDFCLDDF